MSTRDLPEVTPGDVGTPASDASDAVMWSLRFISGKYQGGEFPLRSNREIVIGRSSDLDMVLVEDMVSRKHATISTDDRAVSIQDLGSTNGTFVNGEKIRNVEIKEGDRILIGTSIIKLCAHNGEGSSAVSENEARSNLQVAANRRPAAKSMSGSIEEIPLPDLVQLLSTSRKSGVVVVRSDWGTGRLFLRKGQIYFATIDDGFDMGPRKALFRMLTWTQGAFELEPPDERAVLEELTDSTEGMLMDGMRHLDELRALAPQLPPVNATVSVAKPLGGKLRDLSPEELDMLQLVLAGTTSTQGLLDQSRVADLDTAQVLVGLLERGYLAMK